MKIPIVNTRKGRKFLSWVPGLGWVLFALLISASLASDIVGNIASLELLDLTCIPLVTGCVPEQTAYRVMPQEDGLLRARDLFLQAFRLSPGDERLLVHLAEVDFLRGDREVAVSWLSGVSQINFERSWLSTPVRYPSFLLSAWNDVLYRRWTGALENFRQGLFWAGSNALPSDETAYAVSLGNHYLAIDPENTSERLLAGMYLLAGGKTAQAHEVFTSIVDRATFTEPSNDSLATAYRYLGIIARSSERQTEAKFYFRQASELDPDYRLSLFNLLQSYQTEEESPERELIRKRMNSLGPTYMLGLTGDLIDERRPTLVGSGWELVGYDLESRLVPDAHKIDILLWWKNNGKQPLADGMIDTGTYVLQEQVVVNLLPNPGMEWGTNDQEIPVGYDREFYTGDPDNLVVTRMQRGNATTMVVMARNTSDVRSLALTSKIIPVNPDSLTLMAGWILYDHNRPNIGRNCWGKNFSPGGPYYIAYTQASIDLTTWIHVADAAVAVPGSSPELCEALFINYESEKPAAWDDLIWVEIQSP